MSVVVTGASGFIGREVLRAAGDDAVAFEGDLLAERLELPAGTTAVVHLAQARGYRSLRAEVVAVNVTGTAKVLEAAARAGVGRVVLASSATVYAMSDEPLTEDAPLRSRTVYGASKRAAELIAEPWRATLAIATLRLFPVYGPGQRDRLVPDLIDRVRERRAVHVEGERGLLISPLYVADAAAAVLAAARNPTPDVLNVGGPDRLGIAEVAQGIGTALDVEPVLEHLAGPEPGGYLADRTRLRAALPDLGEPVAFAAGIRETVAAAGALR